MGEIYLQLLLYLICYREQIWDIPIAKIISWIVQ